MNEVAVVNQLELEVSKLTLGTLVTNARELKSAVVRMFDDLTPETYKGDADSARKARAFINGNIKKLNDRRIELEREWNEPFSEFKGVCNEIVGYLKDKAEMCDVIVKKKDAEAKQAKRRMVEALWFKKQFDLVPLEKVFSQKWLNKTSKEKDVSDEMDAAIQKIYRELKIVESAGEDAETLKAHYLISLNLDETLAYGQELRAAKEKAADEARKRAEREHAAQIESQKRDIAEQSVELSDERQSLASAALDMKKPEEETKEYVVSVKATDRQLLQLKSAMTSLGVAYSVEELTF